MGLQAKLAQNLVIANIMQGFVEGMALAVKGGSRSRADARYP